jgi:hypothetical protein
LAEDHMAKTAKYSAKIVRIADHGLAFVSTGSGSERKDLPFTFDKIRSYKGQSPEAIGLKKGANVVVSEVDGRIESVVLDSLE